MQHYFQFLTSITALIAESVVYNNCNFSHVIKSNEFFILKQNKIVITLVFNNNNKLQFQPPLTHTLRENTQHIQNSALLTPLNQETGFENHKISS